MPITVVNEGPRYTYEKPTEKPQLGAPKQLGTDINSYKLPAIDTQEKRRNFSGYQVNQYFTLDEIRQGDGPGTTETDSKTDPKGSGGYTSINKKSGPGGRSWKRS